MIPVSVTMKGFRSYRAETTIDFTGLSSVALVGSNGAGKSTLLSAIPFALYGVCSSGDIDEEVNKYESEAEVRFVFELDGSRYRVTRTRKAPTKTRKQGKSSALLERASTSSSSGWEMVTNAIRQVDAEVEHLLGVDADVMMASVFAGQGDIGRFSGNSKPSERRALLYSILGLDRYDKARELANTRRRGFKSEADGLMGKRDALVESADTLPDLLDELDQMVAAAAEAGDAADKAEAGRMEARQSLDASREAASDAERTLADAIQRLDSDRERLQSEAALNQTLLDSLREEGKRSEERAKEVAKADSRQADIHDQLERISVRRGELSEELASLVTELADAEGQVGNLQQTYDRVSAELASLESERESKLSAHAAMTETIDEIRDASAGSSSSDSNPIEDVTELEASLSSVQQEWQGADRRVAVAAAVSDSFSSELSEVQSADDCRLCGQSLHEDARRHAIDVTQSSFENAERTRQHAEEEESELRVRLKDLRSRHEASQRRLNESLSSLEGLAAVSAQGDLVSLLTARREQLVDQGKALAAKIGEQSERLATGSEMIDNHTATLDRINARKSELDNEFRSLDMEEKAARDVLNELEAHTRSTFRSSADVNTEIGSVESTLAAAEASLAALSESTAVAEATEALKNRKAEALKAADALNVAEKAEKEATQRADEAKSKVIKTKSECDLMEDALKKASDVDVLIEEARTEIETLRMVETAFGPNGIPAMILDEVIVEMTSIVTDLLTDLSNGRFTVEFRTVAETKSGSTKQSLDIIIRDGTKERPYQTFSGGERMRIDIAIRIGLSVMLSRRAGRPLEFLTIDEGFGALDNEGVNTLTTALSQLQQRFKFIAVVTHVPEVAETFPARFEFVSNGKKRSPSVTLV